jgi:hypothetical protein
MNVRTIALTLATCFTALTVCFAQDANIGTWKLNEAKSKPSYTALLVNFFPSALVPLIVTVRLFPSAETTMRPLVLTLPAFLTLNPKCTTSSELSGRVCG